MYLLQVVSFSFIYSLALFIRLLYIYSLTYLFASLLLGGSVYRLLSFIGALNV